MKKAIKGIIGVFIVMMMIITVSSCGSPQKESSPPVDSVNSEIDTTLISPDTVSVVDVSYSIDQQKILVTTNSNNTIKRGASGAIIGAGASYLLGGSMTKGGMLGGTIGLATSQPETSESYYKTVETKKYTVVFSDGTSRQYDEHSPYKIGDTRKSW